MIAVYVDALPKPALRAVCTQFPSFLRYCLQNLVQYFKLAYAFSV